MTKQTIVRAEPEFAAFLGMRLRSLRESAGKRQDDIAHTAKSVGLSWGRSSVASLEAGTRNLSAFEWILLPEIYGCPAGALMEAITIRPAPTVAAADETDRKVAARLGLTAEQVASRSRALWGRGLAAERDARAGEGSARSSQATRGHVTRKLISELQLATR